MKKVIVDTNFILNCVKEKIDFVYELEFEGFKVIIPEQVLAELVKIVMSKQKFKNRSLAELAINILEKRKFDTCVLDKGDIDKAIVKYVRKNEAYLATLDRALKKKLNGRVVTIVGRKKIEIV